MMFSINGYDVYKTYSGYWAISSTKSKFNNNYDNLINSL